MKSSQKNLKMGRGEKRRGCDARVERKSKKKPGDEDRAEPRLEGEAGIDDRRGYDAGLERKSKKKRGGEDRAEPRLEGEAGVDDRGHPTREDVKPIPEIRQNWMHVGERVCDLFPHIFEIYKVPSDDNSQVVFQSKELLKRKEDRFQFLRGCLETLELDGWFTAGYNDPERKFYTFFYAEGG